MLVDDSSRSSWDFGLGKEMLELFKDWLEGKLDSQETLERYLSYAKKMGLSSCDPKELQKAALLARNKSKWYRLALFNWINLCYELGDLDLETKLRLKALATPKKKKTTIPNSTPVIDLDSIENLPERIRPYFILLYYSGARGSEILEAKKRISELECEGEICWIIMNWQRGNKKVFVLFAPKWVWEEVRAADPISIHYLKKVARNVIPNSKDKLKAFRKFWYNKCLEVCDSKICDFLQGRKSDEEISLRHYLSGLEWAKRCYPKIKERLEGKEVDTIVETVQRVREIVEELRRKGLL